MPQRQSHVPTWPRRRHSDIQGPVSQPPRFRRSPVVCRILARRLSIRRAFCICRYAAKAMTAYCCARWVSRAFWRTPTVRAADWRTFSIFFVFSTQTHGKRPEMLISGLRIGGPWLRRVAFRRVCLICGHSRPNDLYGTKAEFVAPINNVGPANRRQSWPSVYFLTRANIGN